MTIQSQAYTRIGTNAALINKELGSLPEKYGWSAENANGYCIRERLSGTNNPVRIIHDDAGASGICFSKFTSETLNNVGWVCYDQNHEH